ncbi:zinc finger CCHC domain-containing protein 12-like [Haliotis cracherodii]|uniref:zinc finger CCHC domain-containing protein 12-like n=1 Tax=Haliotis cracherodii TaxID=6455 RepID=UPI0039EA6FBD
MSKPPPEEFEKRISYFQALGTWPTVDNPEDLVQWMRAYTQTKVKAEDGSSIPPSIQGTLAPVTLAQAPKVPSFSGDKKGETSFDVWKYHVECLFQNKSFSPQAVVNIVQQSLRGKAATVAMCLGPEADIKQLISKLEATFGSVDRGQSPLANFYSSRQEATEEVALWACRLEHSLLQAEAQGPVPQATRNEMLRTQLWSGSKPGLRDQTAHIYDQGSTVDDLLRALRRAEVDLQQGAGAKKKISTPNMAAVSTQDTEMKEIKGMLRQLSSEVADLKKQQITSLPVPSVPWMNRNPGPIGPSPNLQPPPQPQYWAPPPGTPSWYQDERGNSRNQRPSKDSITGEPICFRCNQPGHLQYGCRVILDQRRTLNRKKPMGRGKP